MQETCNSFFLDIAPAGRVLILVYARLHLLLFIFKLFSLCLSLSYASAIDLLITSEAVSAATFGSAEAVQHLAGRERPAAPHPPRRLDRPIENKNRFTEAPIHTDAMWLPKETFLMGSYLSQQTPSA